MHTTGKGIRLISRVDRLRVRHVRFENSFALRFQSLTLSVIEPACTETRKFTDAVYTGTFTSDSVSLMRQKPYPDYLLMYNFASRNIVYRLLSALARGNSTGNSSHVQFAIRLARPARHEFNIRNNIRTCFHVVPDVSPLSRSVPFASSRRK